MSSFSVPHEMPISCATVASRFSKMGYSTDTPGAQQHDLSERVQYPEMAMGSVTDITSIF